MKFNMLSFWDVINILVEKNFEKDYQGKFFEKNFRKNSKISIFENANMFLKLKNFKINLILLFMSSTIKSPIF